MDTKNLERPPLKLLKGIALIILASLANALMAFFVKLASYQISLSIILLARFAITLFILLSFMAFFTKNKEMSFANLKTKRLSMHLFRDIMGLMSVGSYFYTAHYLSLANATVLFSTAPFFVPLISYIWQRIKIIHRLWWGMGIGFIGIIILLHPGKSIISWPAVVGIFSGFTAGVALVSARLLSYSEPGYRSMFYYFSIATLLSLISIPLTSAYHHLWEKLTLPNMSYLFLIGITGYFYQFFLTFSMRFAPVRLTSPFLFSTAIFSLVIDWVIWQDIPNVMEWLGMILIIAGAALMVILYPRHQDYQKKINSTLLQ